MINLFVNNTVKDVNPRFQSTARKGLMSQTGCVLRRDITLITCVTLHSDHFA
jgi:hypothetical protein